MSEHTPRTMKDRQRDILLAIVDAYISSAQPVGSQHLLQEKYGLNVSSATIRNDMAALEEANYLYQPHTSSGRVPTQHGYRVFASEMILREFPEVAQLQHTIEAELQRERQERTLREAVGTISRHCGNVAFALVGSGDAYFLGLSNFLQQPEYQQAPSQASTVVRVLEDKDRFQGILDTLAIEDEPSIFIGEENIIPEISSCGLVVCRVVVAGEPGYLGVLGPLRMHYPRNAALLRAVKRTLGI